MVRAVSWKQKLGIRLLAITHDINKLSSRFVRSKSINKPTPDTHAEDVLESIQRPTPFWLTTAQLPLHTFELPSDAPLWYVCWKHHSNGEDLILRTFKQAEVYTSTLSFYTIPYGRKQTDAFLFFRNMLWLPDNLEQLRSDVELLLPAITGPLSEEDARRYYFELGRVLELLSIVPADTRELSPSYSKHVQLLEDYFLGAVQPLKHPTWQTYRTLIVMGLNRYRLLNEFYRYVTLLLPWYAKFLDRQIKRVEVHYLNTKSPEALQRLNLLHEELCFLKTVVPSAKPGDPNVLFQFMRRFHQDPKPSSIYKEAASILASLRLHSDLGSVLTETGFLIRTDPTHVQGVVERIAVDGAFEVKFDSQTIKVPIRYMVLASAVLEDDPQPFDLTYQGKVLRPLCRLRSGDAVSLCLPRDWLL